jgi:tryptophan-rich sensory protein
MSIVGSAKRNSGLLVFLALVAAAGLSGSIFEPGDWYAGLDKPAWTPPNSWFPPVWAALYVMIALAGFIVWRAQGFGPALWLWIVQLALSAAWSWLMFGRHEIGLALADVVAMWLAIGAFIIVAWPVRRSASLLFVPYFLWVSFAAALNFEIWRLNT